MQSRKAFTLLELLISIALLSIVLMALYQSLSMLRASNSQLFDYLTKAQIEKRAIETLFKDIAGSDGKITITGDEYARLCIDNTINSLYELPSAKVCWLVLKKDNTLVRSEGNDYELPLDSEARVAVDSVIKNIDVFQVYRKGSEVLVLLQEKGKASVSFMVMGVSEPVKKKKKNPKDTKNQKSKNNPSNNKQIPNRPNTAPPPNGDPTLGDPRTPNLKREASLVGQTRLSIDV